MWLDVSEDLSIIAKEIIAVEALDGMNSTVYTESRTFRVPLPKSVIMSMVESRVKGGSSMSNVERLLTEIYKGQATQRP